MYNDTVTIFNRYHSASGDTWYPTIVRNADFHADRAAIVAQYGENSGDRAKLHIRTTVMGLQNYIAGKPYYTPKLWNSLTNDSLGRAITFQTGNNFDFFWVGEWPSEEPIPDENYKRGFYDHMVMMEDNVFAITSVGGPYDLIPHVEILGK